MKMKNLVAYAMLALGAVATPFAASAVDFDGHIRSINAMPDYQQSILYPNSTAPLSVGQDAYILVRLLNVNYGETMADETKVSPWYFKPRAGIGVTTLTNTMYRPMIGLSIGGRRQYATFSETGPNGEVSGPNTEFKYYTDLYFKYTVQPGDLGLPIKMLQTNGQVGTTYGDFMLVNVNTGSVTYNPWDLTNDSDGTLAKFRYGPETVSPAVSGKPSKPKADEVRTYDFSTEGVYVQTVDFDKTNYEGQPWRKGQVWRVVNEDGVTVDGGDRPTVEGSGEYTVYVWSADDTVAYVEPDGAGSSDFDDGSGRRIVKITGSGTAPVSFKVKAAAGAEVDDTVDIYLSSGPSQGYSEVGDKLENSTSVRQVRIGAPSDPYISITTYTGESKVTNLVATVNYEQELKLKVSVNKPYAEDIVIAFNPKFRDVPVADMNPTNGYVKFLTTVDNPIRSAGICEVTLKAGKDSAEFYLYALGSAGKASSYLDLTPSVVDDPDATAYYKGSPKTLEIRLKDQAPDILQPAAGTVYSGREGSVIDGFDVEVADNWRDLQPTLATNGYEIVVEGMGVEKFTTNAVHFTDGGVVTLPVRVNASGTALTATVKVKDPQGNVSSREVTINSTPKPKAKVQFYADRDMRQPLGGNTFNEGEIPYVGVSFTEGKAPANMYAFLVPTDVNATNLVECDAKTNGLKIAMGDTNSTVMAMNFLDGFTQVNPMKAKFAIRFLSTPTLGGEGTPIDYTDDCGSPTFEVNAVNVSPTVDQVFLDGGGIVDGEMFSKVPAGIEKLYAATLLDPSRIDLLYGPGYAGREIWVRWEYTDDYEGWETARANYAYSTNGTDGAEVRLSFTYENTLQRVRLYALDKDDRAAQGTSDLKKLNWGKPLFTFYVDVAPTQRIIISDKSKMALGEDGELIFLEDQKQTTGTQGDFYISLSEIPGRPYAGQREQPIRVKLTWDKWGGGVLNVHTQYVYFAANDKKEKPIRIDTATLNGSDDAEWSLTAAVDMEDKTAKDIDGNPWDEHYAPAYAEVYVRNVAPVINTAAAKGTRPWSTSMTNVVSAGESVLVNWAITDITNDFCQAYDPYDWKYDNFEIQWSVDSADTVKYPNPQVITNGWQRRPAKYSMGQIYGDYQFNVPARDGYSKITMTVSDGDGESGIATVEWWIYVSPAKRLKVDVFGPKATAQSKYKAAKGIGQGLVAAKGTLALCEQFAQTWEYDELTASADLWAWGYPATNTWAQFLIDYAIPPTTVTADNTRDEGKIPTYLGSLASGVPLNKLGNKHAATDTTWYDWATHGDRDPDAGAYDSFFYRWMVVKAAQSAEGGSGDSELTPAPTFWPFDASTANFTLDAGEDKKNSAGAASYGTVEVEAIFSKELRPKDNLGDINADGIPDKMVELYGFGANIGEYPEDDLASLSAYNDDEDYLPNTAGSAIHSSLIPGLPGSWGEGQEFTAVMEVRGAYADEGVSGLNDGARLAGLSQQRLEPGFNSDDVEVRKAARDYSALEMMAWAEHGYAKDWSPERPTDPTKEDTDEDKFPDGYEYYFWYKAHVGYIENGVHRYLSGRAYDPRNPGEGRYLPAVVIARLMDPRSDLAAVDIPERAADQTLLTELLATDKKTRDTDNDGLPDALEFELGTNPFDFDTDGDGLPDGFEIMLGGTDPLLESTTKGVSDAMRNFDGDAMAFTTPYLEANGFVLPEPLHTDTFQRFALVDETGDTDGIQWYVGRTAPTNIIASAETFSGVSFTRADRTNVTYVTSRTTLPVVDGRLACDLLKSEVRTMISTNDDFGVEGDVNIALMPVMIPAGTPVTNVSETVVEYRTLSLAEDLENASTAWVYGRSVSGETTGDSLANLGGFGMLAIGRYQTAKAGLELAALPAQDDGVAYLHHFVYQEFGFDPRTAWNANTPLAPRWGKTVTTGEGETETAETVANNYTLNYGYAGVATRTREFTLYDEFLVLSFFLNNGRLAEADVTPTQAVPWEKIWSKYTTNGQGPNEPNWEPDNEHFKGRTSETASGDNGADTDMDGVPDGWELYVMAGPKVEDRKTKEKVYNLVAPYNDGFFSSFGPFVKDAAKASMTDNNATGGRSSTGGDADGLTELQEYAGTDSCAYYCEPWGGNEAPFSTTIVRPAEHKDWLNKFFPTDPWNADTDGDGLGDNEISGNAGKFKYGTPVDDGKLCSIPGGGLNPCTVDTDLDGLPDPWEAQFAGKTVYAGDDAQITEGKDGTQGNPRQGLCDGMDGTVPDAFNTPHVSTSTGSETSVETETEVIILNGIAQVVDRDYDKDGLDNWQEYMTGAMRVWRYDDPRSSFDWSDKVLGGEAGAIIPDGAFFDDLGNFDLAAAMLYTGISDPNEFWYRTLFDRTSKWYNPHFITGTAPGTEYFSRVTNGWDQAFTEAGSYYIFFDRQNDQMYKDTWGYMGAAPTKYICTSPIDADTDHDGMDDGYELFHGMNPLLGAAAVLASEQGPCDIVFDAWYKRPAGSPVDALNNNWTTGLIPGDFDFTVNPWLNGLVDADPDGDDIRNQDEAIMPLVAPSQTWFHTDPTPLWMTDSSYRDSLVTRFFRMPNALGEVPVPETVEFDGKTFSTRDLDGYMVVPLIGPVIAPFTLGYWSVPLAYSPNWMYSFEENEGYDTDHDAGSDFEELQGKVRRKTDPQDADSPRRRQAMYFPGPAEPSALQTMPFVHELYPRAASGYPDDLSFLQYTVECWVRPESTADATVLERTSYVHPSHVADERYVRRNFAIMIRGGKWCTEFDANGTLDASTVRVLGKTDVEPGKWTYVAATYDANNLILYVNGGEDGRTASSLKPEYGSSAVVVYPAGSTVVSTNNGAGAGADIVMSGGHSYWFDSEYSLNAFLIGASFTNGDGRQLDVTAGAGWRGRYADFFTGYVDEIRVWDGAQSADVIAANHATRKRYTREDAIANRNAFYDEWIDGKLRYRKDGSGKDMDVVPELRFHWTFDSLPGAENAARVLKAPHGFLDQAKPVASRPSDYEVPWWSGIVGAYGSVYAGERNCWVPWIPNTVTHLPRFDGSTLDSAYWSEDAAGDTPGIYRFARTAEPVSKWTQMVRNLTESSLQFQTGNRRYWHSYNTGTNGTSMLSRLFEFTGRHLNQTGDDLLPLGGAFAKYVDTMWDDQGASTLWEQTGVDVDNDGLPDWWQEYAEQNYRKDGVPPEGVDINWDTVINYDVGGSTVRITAGEAYLRDLAKGTYLDAGGKVQIGPTDYIQTADEDANGIPDWWAEMYGIRGESGLADHDNDGLPNYVEYLLSEVFAFKTLFDPTVPDSVRQGIPDYFYRPAGCQLYVGEIFTDHDLVDDAWEDLYDKKDPLDKEIYASRLAWDAFADTDEDGWSNRSENRYAKMVMPIVANEKAHYTPADGLVADYPIPTLSLKLRYNGNRQNAVSAAPIAVQVTTDATLAKDPDATYRIGAAADTTAGTGTTSDKENAGKEVARTRTIGKWSDRRVIGTLTPGNIKIDSIKLQNCYDPSSTTYAWRITGLVGFTDIFRGTRSEYDDALRKYGSDNVKLVSATAGYKDLQDLKLTSDEKSIVATWTTKTGDTLGTVNLVTGEFSLDLGVFKGWTVSDASDTNRTESTSMEDQTYRIAYATNPSVGLPRELYLGEADTGHVKEGRNSIVAWAETVAADGVWQPGEPYGIVRDVDVSWRGTAAEIELTDISPVTPRIDLLTADSDRGETATEIKAKIREQFEYDYSGASPVLYSNALERLAWMNVDVIDPATITPDTFRNQRLRVVRWLINDIPAYSAGSSMRTVLDKKIETDVRSCLTEADFLIGNGNVFDLDWAHLYNEVIDNRSVTLKCGDVRSVGYLVVVGDGPADWDTLSSTNYTVHALDSVIIRKFGEQHVKPVAVAPGAVSEEIVRSANPTFKWTMDCPEEEGYTAFNVQVLDGSTVIYDSDKVLAPSRNDQGQYEWSAPLFVGDRTLKGKVFENKKSYTWQVSMYNAKYSAAAVYSNVGRFFMEVQTNGYDYGSANVAVRYFGPTETWEKKNPVIRVRAYTSPDFTGLPVAAGYVAKPDDPANGLLAGTNAAPNCTVVGIPRGTYYLQAFIDSNGNGACDPWETQGYLCTRDGSKPDSLDPTTITFDSKIGKGDLAIIYLEDADTDGDGLPDAWEWAVYGSLTAKGTELLTETKAGEFVVNAKLSGALDLQKNARVPTAGLASEIGSRFNNAGFLALAMGAPVDKYDGNFMAAIEAALAPELEEGGVSITELGLKDGRVTIALAIATTSGAESPLAKFFDANGKLTVVCEILWTPTLAQTPKVIYATDVVVGDEPVEVDISTALEKAQKEAGADGSSAFFSAKVYKK